MKKTVKQILREVGISTSMGEARRLIYLKGLKINGQVILDIDETLDLDDGFVELQMGKKKAFTKLLGVDHA